MQVSYCSHCGGEIRSEPAFCPHCGNAQPSTQVAPSADQLAQQEESRQVARDKNSDGVQRLKDGQYESALTSFTDAIIANPEYALAYRNRAQAYDDLGRAQEAVADRATAASLQATERRETPEMRLQAVPQRIPYRPPIEEPRQPERLGWGRIIVAVVIGVVLSSVLALMWFYAADVSNEDELMPLKVIRIGGSIIIAGMAAAGMAGHEKGTHALWAVIFSVVLTFIIFLVF